MTVTSTPSRTGSRVRTSRPTTRPSSGRPRSSCPPGTSTVCSWRRGGRAIPGGRDCRASGTVIVASRSTASSHGTWAASPVSSRSASATRPRSRADGPSLHVQEPHLHGELAGAALHHDAGAEGARSEGSRGDHVGGHQHAPLEAHLVLRRGGAVGVEHVALVEHRVGEPRAPRRSGQVAGSVMAGSSRSRRSRPPSRRARARCGRRPAGRRCSGRGAARPGRGSGRPSPPRQAVTGSPAPGLGVPRHRRHLERSRRPR